MKALGQELVPGDMRRALQGWCGLVDACCYRHLVGAAATYSDWLGMNFVRDATHARFGRRAKWP
jgi:hypothetical protein